MTKVKVFVYGWWRQQHWGMKIVLPTFFMAGLETNFFINSQTFMSGFNLNSQIAVSYSLLVCYCFRRRNITIVKIYHWQAHICRCIHSGVRAKAARLHVHPKMAIKYLCKHWIRSSELGQFYFLLSCQLCRALRDTQLSSYWFLKLLNVNRWHFSVGSLPFVLLSKFDNK